LVLVLGLYSPILPISSSPFLLFLSDPSEEKESKSRRSPVADLADDSSNSSDDRPIQETRLRESKVAGTKRKAEVLSKESGKIGVTITTSPGSSVSPPPVKTPKILEAASSTLSSVSVNCRTSHFY